MCMYEVNEHWKQYKQEKDLQAKLASEFGLDKLLSKEKAVKEFDKFINKLITKNGVTKL